MEAGRRCSATLSDPVLEAVGVPALLAAQVDEEVSGPGRVLGGHVPHDAEGVTGHLANLDIAWCGEGRIHLGQLPLKPKGGEGRGGLE